MLYSLDKHADLLAFDEKKSIFRKAGQGVSEFSNPVKDNSDYLAFTRSYSKFVYHSTFLCEPVLPRSQPIQICCTTIDKYANKTTIFTSLTPFFSSWEL